MELTPVNDTAKAPPARFTAGDPVTDEEYATANHD